MADQQQNVPQNSPPASAPSPRKMSPQQAKQELKDAIAGSNQVLATASTVLTLLPDTMIVDRAKVTVTKRTFFRVADVMSIRIEDVLNATCSVGPFLGRVEIVSRVMSTTQPGAKIGKFWRSDAKKLKRIIQGYVIALQRGIDCSKLGTRELADMLEKLGADNHPEA